MKKVITTQREKIKENRKKQRKKIKRISSIDTIIMEKEALPQEKENEKINYEWLNSLIIAMPDEVVREKVRKLFSKSSDEKDALVDKLIMEII
ncbi:MAG: hypothetical protein N2053_00330 [Chitinispirillaceae bacterium]|nr:hypothetical protein [Chitinispirillaceae bacterium]